MNESKIEWCDMTWNPVTGCLHGCPYCYARRIAYRFGLDFAPKMDDPDFHGCKYDSPEGLDTMAALDEPYRKGGKIQPYPMAFYPTFHRYRLDEPIRKTRPRKIFVCSMADLFGDWVPDEWIQEVFETCEKAPQHKYLFLTKNPKRYMDLNDRCILPANKNFWYGMTVTKKSEHKLINYNPHYCGKPIPTHRNTFLSVEPLQDDTICELIKYYGYCFKWIIVGAQTGPGAVAPKPEWVQNIIDQARAADIPIFLKDNLNWPEKIQEFPEGLN